MIEKRLLTNLILWRCFVSYFESGISEISNSLHLTAFYLPMISYEPDPHSQVFFCPMNIPTWYFVILEKHIELQNA
jgi:hypothetical protein